MATLTTSILKTTLISILIDFRVIDLINALSNIEILSNLAEMLTDPKSFLSSDPNIFDGF